MRDCSRPWREEREGAALGFIIQGYWFPSNSYHQPTQRHWRPWVREKEGLSDGDRTRTRLTGSCSLSRASYLSFFLFLRPSTFLLPARCINLHTDWHLFKPSCLPMTSLRLIISLFTASEFNPFILTGHYLIVTNRLSKISKNKRENSTLYHKYRCQERYVSRRSKIDSSLSLYLSFSLSELSTFANSRSNVILVGPSSRIRISPSVPMELTELGRKFETFHP